MDARAYLQGLGWRGEGHSLDNHGRGIKKPLLISHKQDQSGLGKKKAAEKISDQWWLRAFDESLQSIGTGKETALDQVRELGVSRGGLYGFFVKGEVLVGTVGAVSVTEGSSAAESAETSAEPSRTTTPPTSASDSSSEDDSASESSEDTDSDGDASEDNDSVSAMSDDLEITDTPAVQPVEEQPEEEQPAGSKKRKRVKETAEEIRKRRKEMRIEKAKIEGKMKREKEREEAIANGTYDEALAKTEKVLADINREVNRVTKQNANRGMYGPILPHPSTLRLKKGEANTNFIEDPNNPGKKLTYKAAKYAREKAMREAKRDMRMELIVRAQERGELDNPNNYGPEELLENFEFERKRRAREQRTNEERLKAIKLEEKNAKRAQRKEEKKARKEQRRVEREAKEKERKKLLKEQWAREKAERAAQKGEGQSFENNADTIPLEDKDDDEEFEKSLKHVPGWGKMDHYPTKREKKIIKDTAAAEALGLTLEQYRTQQALTKNKSQIDKKLASLSAEERAKYEERAAAKKQTIEEYVWRRIEKKDNKRAERDGVKQDAPEAEVPETQEEEELGFVIDTEGNENLVARAAVLADPNAPVPADPAIWEGRDIKTLTKAERKARLEWIRARRAARKEAKGIDPRSTADRKRNKAQRKMDKQRRLTGEILKGVGKAKGATKEEIVDARRKAKRIMKEEKKVKKGKENKLVLNLKGRHRVSERARERNARLAGMTEGVRAL